MAIHRSSCEQLTAAAGQLGCVSVLALGSLAFAFRGVRLVRPSGGA